MYEGVYFIPAKITWWGIFLKIVILVLLQEDGK